LFYQFVLLQLRKNGGAEIKIIREILIFLLLITETAFAGIITKTGLYHIKAQKVTHLAKINTYILNNATITKGQLSISAHTMIINNKKLNAYGKVILLDGANKIWAKKLMINLNTGKGIIDNAVFFIKSQHIFIKTDRGYKISKKSYILGKFSLTGCGNPKKPFNFCPDWQIVGTSAKIVKGKYIKALNNRMLVRSTPVLYSPYIYHNLNKKRRSGFLFPTFGYSTLYGVRYNQPFYLTIGRSMDMTFTVKEQSKNGIGLDVEHRYAATKQIGGKTFLSYLHKKGNKSEKRKNIWNISTSHHYNLKNGRILIQYNHISNRFDYADLNNDNIDFYASRYIKSQILADYNYKNWNFGIHSFLYQDLDSHDDSHTLQSIPEIVIKNNDTKIGKSPLYWSLDYRFTNFYRREGNKGIVSETVPALELPYNVGYFRFSDTFRIDTAFYKNTQKGNHFAHTRVVPEFSHSISTDVMKQYGIGENRLLHLITPEIIYSFIPTISQDKLPDYLSKIDSKSQITFKVEQRLINKIDNLKHTLMYLDIEQPYDLNRLNRGEKPLEPLFMDMHADIRHFSYFVKLHYDHYKKQFVDFNSGISYRGAFYGTINYQISNDSNFTKISEELNSIFQLPLSKILNITLTNNYSLLYHYFTLNQIDADIKKSCWQLSVSAFRKTIPSGNKSIRDNGMLFTITLKGLGNFLFKG